MTDQNYGGLGPLTPPDNAPLEPVPSGPLVTGPTTDPASAGQHLPDPGSGPLPGSPAQESPHAGPDELGFDFTGESGIVGPEGSEFVTPGEPTMEQGSGADPSQAGGGEWQDLDGL